VQGELGEEGARQQMRRRLAEISGEQADTLALAKKLGKTDPFLETIREQMGRLDPIQVGADGQIKEYREETHYSDIGDPKHRHISHICPLFPGTLINPSRPEWMQAASKTLDLRGDKTTGWALAHRMNSRARLGEGDKAHEVYQRFIRERTVPNLWTLHPPFQIDGNLGTMAGVAALLPWSVYEELVRAGDPAAEVLERAVLDILSRRLASTNERLGELHHRLTQH
jgi:hypothetical protein